MRVTLFKLVGLSLILFGNASLYADEDADKETAKISSLTETFWKAMTSKSFADAEKSLFTSKDDPDLPQSEIFATDAKEEFEKIVELVKSAPEAIKTKSITVEGFGTKLDRRVAGVTLLVWEPKDEEYEKLTISWIKSTEGGWKLIEL